MSTAGDGRREAVVEQEYELDAPLAKVWRALSIRELRESWLPAGALAEPEPSAVTPGRELSYRMREEEAPFLESLVTFRIDPTEAGGTRLKILHELTDARLRMPARTAANGNGPLMRAAA